MIPQPRKKFLIILRVLVYSIFSSIGQTIRLAKA